MAVRRDNDFKTKEENEDREKLQTESPGMSGSSGIGGKPFGLPDLRSIQEAAAKGQQRGGAPGITTWR